MKFKGSTLYVVLAYDCFCTAFIAGVFSKRVSAEKYVDKCNCHCDIIQRILQ